MSAGEFRPTEGLGRHFGDYQDWIYFEGMQGRRQEWPGSVEELEAAAREALSPQAYAYAAGAAGAEDTVRANLEAFKRWAIVPRVLRDVSQRDHRVSLFGTEMPAPLLLGPIGQLGTVYKNAEIACARAAASMGVPLILSTLSSTPLEAVAQASGGAPRWFQLYWPRDPELAKSFVRRAEDSGYSALVVTLDTRLLGWRERDLKLAYLPFMEGEGLANYFTDPVFRASLPKPPEEDLQAAFVRLTQVFSDPGQTWTNLRMLRDCCSLPIVLKGVLHPDDARRAVEEGMDGLIVSNHGGRQVDGAIAALDTLPGVVAAVEGRVPVLFDSGIRRGADMVKALALGAKAVLLGRPYVWGLAVGGEAGVRTVLQRLLAEFDITMALSGYARPDELSAESMVYEPR